MKKNLAVPDRLKRNRGENQLSGKELTDIFNEIEGIVNAVACG